MRNFNVKQKLSHLPQIKHETNRIQTVLYWQMNVYWIQ